MKSCDEIKNLLSEYIDGELDKEAEAEIAAHIKDCKNCSEELEILKLIKDTASDSLEEPPYSIAQKVTEKINRDKKRKNKILRFPLYAGGAAAACFMIFVAVSSLNHGIMKKNAQLSEERYDTTVTNQDSCGDAGSENFTADASTQNNANKDTVQSCVNGNTISSAAAVSESNAVSTKKSSSYTAATATDGQTKANGSASITLEVDLIKTDNSKVTIKDDGANKVLNFLTSISERAENKNMPESGYDKIYIIKNNTNYTFHIKDNYIYELSKKYFTAGNAVKLSETEVSTLYSYFKQN